MWKIFFLMGCLMMPLARAVTLPTDFILAEMAKNCIGKKVRLNGAISRLGATKFVGIKIGEDGMSVNDESINTYFLANIISCEHSAKRIKEYLASHGVDVKKSGHGLFNFEPVYIIGADESDRASPQLWILKKDFLPVKERAQGREIIFDKWATIDSLVDKKLPSIISISAGGEFETISLSDGSVSKKARR